MINIPTLETPKQPSSQESHKTHQKNDNYTISNSTNPIPANSPFKMIHQARQKIIEGRELVEIAMT